MGCAGLQGHEDAAAGGSVSPPPSREEARDGSMMAGGEQAGDQRPKPFPWTQPRTQSLVYQFPSSGKGSSVCCPFSLPGHYSPK